MPGKRSGIEDPAEIVVETITFRTTLRIKRLRRAGRFDANFK